LKITMPDWNEKHYARAQEFLRLLADAIPAPMPARTGTARPVTAPASPAPAVPAPEAAPTAASVFQKIPWKK
jgi:hypothetical protein